jgi:head-tail adaptor
MQPAGDYRHRLSHLIASRLRNDETGEDEETHTPSGYLWCNVNETNGRRGIELGATQTGADATIRIRNYPSVKATDLLRDEARSHTWRIDSIHRGEDELIATCYRLDSLLPFEIEESSS